MANGKKKTNNCSKKENIENYRQRNTNPIKTAFDLRWSERNGRYCYSYNTRPYNFRKNSRVLRKAHLASNIIILEWFMSFYHRFLLYWLMRNEEIAYSSETHEINLIF